MDTPVRVTLAAIALRGIVTGIMQKVRAIIIREHGEPELVAKMETMDLPAPAAGDVRVRVKFSPINPADINVLEGKYPIRPELPGTPGVEGVGVVEECGAGVTGFAPGDAVLLPHRFGAWREVGNANAADLLRIAPDVPLEQAAMLRINPATALLMLRDFVSLQPGEWIVQNAANSAVGRCVIRLAKHFGWRTVNVVRRPELVDKLKAEGADVVLVEGEKISAEIKAATGGVPIHLALNAVGGDSATRLAGSLAPGGTIVTYGAMARQPLKIPNGLLIFQDIAWRGFWVSRWYQRAGDENAAALLAELATLAARGIIATPVEAIYPLGQIADALAHAQRPQRGGKILLRCS
ncbi:MAG: 2-enoyl thioester reductase domain-containing protein [Chthoniobacteraceae bacterium]